MATTVTRTGTATDNALLASLPSAVRDELLRGADVKELGQRAILWEQGEDRFSLTQEFLAEMLGVRRATVTLAAGMLQKAGLIRYRQGIIEILDPDGLHRAACECYDVIRSELDRVAEAR